MEIKRSEVMENLNASVFNTLARIFIGRAIREMRLLKVKEASEVLYVNLFL